MGTLQGIAIAIMVSLLALASQTVHPRVYVLARKPGTHVMRPLSPEHPDDETFDDLLILHPEGRLFFLNASVVAEHINKLLREYHPQTLLLDMSTVYDIEYSALQMLIAGEQKWREQGITLLMSGLTPDVLEAVRRSGLADKLGRERLLFSVEVAISMLYPDSDQQAKERC
jgi:MFS superfamily sulfate permease-like transporter